MKRCYREYKDYMCCNYCCYNTTCSVKCYNDCGKCEVNKDMRNIQFQSALNLKEFGGNV